jgi:hypothetical protein
MWKKRKQVMLTPLEEVEDLLGTFLYSNNQKDREIAIRRLETLPRTYGYELHAHLSEYRYQFENNGLEIKPCLRLTID